MLDKLSFNVIDQQTLLTGILLLKNINQKILSSSLCKTNGQFALKLYKDSNVIISKMQVYSSFYNATYFKYKFAISRKY